VEICPANCCVCFHIVQGNCVLNTEEDHPLAYASCCWIDVGQVIHMTFDAPDSYAWSQKASEWSVHKQFDISEGILIISWLTD
jgi:hypothetical protein